MPVYRTAKTQEHLEGLPETSEALAWRGPFTAQGRTE